MTASRTASIARWVGITRDLVTAAVGVAVFFSTPPSVLEFGASLAAVIAWSFLPLVGGLACAAGLLRGNQRLEVIGTFTVASGFLVWTVAAAAQPDASLVTYAVAGSFLVLSLSFVLRGLVVATGALPADREV